MVGNGGYHHSRIVQYSAQYVRNGEPGGRGQRWSSTKRYAWDFLFFSCSIAPKAFSEFANSKNLLFCVMYQAPPAPVEEANEAHHVQRRSHMLCTAPLDMRKNDLALIPLYTFIFFFFNYVKHVYVLFPYLVTWSCWMQLWTKARGRVPGIVTCT